MDIKLFKNSSSGKLIRTNGGYWAFLPNPLPPPINWDADFVYLLSKADRALGSLSGLGETLPNPHLLIYPFQEHKNRLKCFSKPAFSPRLPAASEIEPMQPVKFLKFWIKIKKPVGGVRA